MVIKNFEDLIVWQKAHALVLKIYDTTKKFPDSEKYHLMQQLRRSSASIAANIVEGHKRKSTKDYIHFLNIAESSLEETKYYLMLSKELTFLKKSNYMEIKTQCDEIGKMLFGLKRSLLKK